MSRRLLAVLALSCALLAAVATSSAFAVQSGTVTVTTIGNGHVSGPGIDCGSDCVTTVAYGDCDTSTKPPVCLPQSITLTADDANGFAFDHWEGCDSASGRSCSVTALSDGTDVTAAFRDAQAPSVTLTFPATSGVITRDPTLTATAIDNVGVARVDFYVRGQLIGSDDTAPYSMYFNTATVADGPALFEARAVDAAGNVSSSSGQTLSIDNTPPALQITSGPDGQTFAPGTTQTWTWTATDPIAGLNGVVCAVDSAAWQDCPSPWSVSGLSAGEHYIVFEALDAAGNWTQQTRWWTIAATAPPTATAKPKITGTAQPGKVLTATTGTWSGSPTSYAYSWQRCNTSGSSCVAIGTADASDNGDYTLTSADAGHTIRVKVTATNGAGSATNTSAATAIIGLPVNTVAPVISGTPKVGTQLTTTSGTWTQGPVTYKYAWQRCTASGSNCVAIGSADATDDADYTPVAADAGHAIRVVVTAKNTAGSAKKPSKATAAVAA